MIAYLSSNQGFSFTRYAPLGYWFIGNNLSLEVSTSSQIRIGFLFPFLEFVFDIHDYFYAPSTNQYTLDHAFDFDSSQCYLSGLPTASGVFVYWKYAPNEFSPRIQIDFGLANSQSIFVDIPAPSSPWYVRP